MVEPLKSTNTVDLSKVLPLLTKQTPIPTPEPKVRENPVMVDPLGRPQPQALPGQRSGPFDNVGGKSRPGADVIAKFPAVKPIPFPKPNEVQNKANMVDPLTTPSQQSTTVLPWQASGPIEYVDFVKTDEGELIPRGPIGQRSVTTTPKGRIINMDSEGFPLTRGPRSEIYPVNKRQVEYEAKMNGKQINPPAAAAQSQEAVKADTTKVKSEQASSGGLQIEDLPILRDEPWLLGGTTREAQNEGLRQLKNLVMDKDIQGYYDAYARDGYTLTFMDKVYIETTILSDLAKEMQKAALAGKVSAEETKVAAPETPIVPPVTQPQYQPIVQPSLGVSNQQLSQNNESLIINPGVTTLIILATFVLTVFQVYKYVKRMMNTKVDYEGFQNTAIVDRAPLISNGHINNNKFANNDEFMEAQRFAQAPETFDFDASEVGQVPSFGDFEEYSGPSVNEFSQPAASQNEEDSKADEESSNVLQNLDKLMEGAKVVQRK